MKKKPGFRLWSRYVLKGGGTPKYPFTERELTRGVRSSIVEFIEDIEDRVFSYDLVNLSLTWSNTIQGSGYWSRRADQYEEMTDYDWSFLQQALELKLRE